MRERTIRRWLAERFKDLKAERDRLIAQMWLACYTEEEIAEAVGLTQQAISTMELQEGASWHKFVILSEYREPDWLPARAA